MKEWYKQQAKSHFKKYEKALDAGDNKAADYHMKEFLNYDKMSK